MSAQTLDSPVVTGDALRSINFFNGRLLTGDDLRAEQSTSGSRLARLGRTVGDGVAHGLQVKETIGTSTKAKPVVTVAAGLALARSGQALELSATVDVALARSKPVAGSEPGGLFADCQPFAPGTYTAGAGVYLLAIGPAAQGEGRAPVSGLSNEPSPCNVATSVEAVRFRLIRLALSSTELADKAHLRNRVAYACFGTDALAGFVADPFGPKRERHGLIDELRDETLGDDEVPLAVVGWSIGDGLQFVDEWSVRRRVVQREPTGRFAPALSDRRQAEGEAMILQFQAQAEDLRTKSPATVRAKDRFLRLPPMGVLPLGVSGAAGFDINHFFEGLTATASAYMPGAKLAALFEESRGYPPIDMGSEAIRRYVVRENQQAAKGPIAPYVVFVNGHVRYRANAEFDLAYWNFANYAQCC